MPLTKKQLEFYTIALVFCIAVSILVMLVDFGIKAAILEESTKLRLLIEENSGRKPKETNAGRTDNDAANNAAVSVPVLVDKPPGMEATHVSNGSQKASTTPRNRRRAQPKGQANDSGIPNGNESVG